MQYKWLSTQQYRKIFLFLGRQGVLYLCLGVLIGILLFCVELGFGFAIQSFLLVIGALSPSTVSLPSLIPHSGLANVLIFFSLTGIIRGFLQWVQIYLSAAALQYQACFQRMRLMKWALHSESIQTADVIHYISCVDGVGNVVNNLQSISILLPVSLLLLAGLLRMAPFPTSLAILFLGILAFCLKSLDQRIQQAGSVSVQATHQVYTRLINNIRNLLLMQIYGTQSRETTELERGLRRSHQSSLVYLRLSGLKFAVPQIFGVLILCIIAYSARSSTHLSPASLISYFYLFVRFVQNFSEMLKSLSNLSFSKTSFMALAKWWIEHSHDSIRHVNERPDVEIPEPFPVPLGWKFSSVSYSYPGASTSVLKDFNLTVRPGEALVITGPSGAGKSTLLSLMLGNLHPTSGTVELIFYDRPAEPLETHRPRFLQSVGYVGPESFLLSGSIHENITYGLITPPTAEEIKDAIEKSESTFIYDLPKGLDHVLSEQGHGLSAGQKQRLSLARALLRKPKILILDEATSNLDHNTEERLVETLGRLRGTMTVIGVTHRPSLLKIADQRLELK